MQLKNVVNTANLQEIWRIKTLSLTGEKESSLSKISDVTIHVPETETYKVQELHLPI